MPSGDIALGSDSSGANAAYSATVAGGDWAKAMDASQPSEVPRAPRASGDAPTAFGRYQVRKALGAGGFGAVYLGHDTQLDRPVAIKVRRGGPVAPLDETERFLEEARRL